MADEPTYYEILGVPRTATQAEIESAYKWKVRVYHSDRFPEADKQRADAELRYILAAYDVLRDATRREKYDMELDKRAQLVRLSPEDSAQELPATYTSDTLLRSFPQAEAHAPERYPFWGYQDVLVLISLALPAFAAAGLLVTWVLLLIPDLPNRKIMQALPSLFLGYGLWFACLFLLLKAKYGRPFWASLRWVYPAKSFWRWAFLGSAVALSVAVLGAVLRTPDIQMPFKDLMTDRVSIALMGIFAVSLGPLCEELAFRGFLFPLVARTLGPSAGVLVTALPFALLHGPQYAWSWRHLLLITLAGAAFGWARYRSGSTAAAAAMHATYNLTFFAGYFFMMKSEPPRW